MALHLRRSSLSRWCWQHLPASTVSPPLLQSRNLRSEVALEAIAKASENRTPAVVLYNYPSFSGAFSALFAHLYHSKLNLQCLILPFSSVVPFRVEDLCYEGLQKCYFLDFIGPEGFAVELSRRTGSEVMCFDHRKHVLPRIPAPEECPDTVKFRVSEEKSSSNAAYEYFSSELNQGKLTDENNTQDVESSLFNLEDQDRVKSILKYIEDGDLHRNRLPNIQAFGIGFREWGSRMNCISNPHMYKQLLDFNSEELIAKGRSYISSRQGAARNLLDKVFRVQLGRGFYGECLGVRADENSHLTNEIGKELSLRSASAGLRPIGAVVYMQNSRLKMCLRTMDSTTDTSEVAKAYGGGGSSVSSSFIIRMDEYNQWLSANTTKQCVRSSITAKLLQELKYLGLYNLLSCDYRT